MVAPRGPPLRFGFAVAPLLLWSRREALTSFGFAVAPWPGLWPTLI